jgi:hypothetical protein
VKEAAENVSGVSQGLRVYSSVIFHASLPSTYLYGSFDSQGVWSDGLLVRKLRSVAKASDGSLHAIILDGPISSSIEQLFGPSLFQQSGVQLSDNENGMNHLVFPSGELFTLPSSVKLIFESADLSHASPALIPLLPHLDVSVSADACIQRLLTVWMRSISNWLGAFPPWTDALIDLEQWVFSPRFMGDILYHDVQKHLMRPQPMISRISTFLRIFEELLLQCHELAVQEATFLRKPTVEDDDVSTGVDTNTSTQKRRVSMSQGDTPRMTLEGTIEDDKTDTHESIMCLGPKGRMKLLKRVRAAFAYAAIWGCGGTANSAEKRKFFDSLVRESLSVILGTGNLELFEEAGVFDLTLDLKEGEFLLAAHRDHRGNIIRSPFLSDRLADECILAEVTEESVGTSHLKFHTTSTRAVRQALQYLMVSGGSVLLMGPRGSGKRLMIEDILMEASKNALTPSKLRDELKTQLLQMLTEHTKVSSTGSSSSGLVRAVDTLKTSLAGANDLTMDGEVADADISKLWRVIMDTIEVCIRLIIMMTGTYHHF